MTGHLHPGPAAAPTTIVVPTVGRPSLRALLASLAAQEPPVDVPVLVVDDRPDTDAVPPGRPDPLEPRDLDPTGRLDVRVLRTGGRGPAGARNLGWRHARTRWVSFLDDDVLVTDGWFERLLADLDAADDGGHVGSKGLIEVPRPEGRRPTDDERGTIGLEDAAWITADMAYRRDALAGVGGFDERFRRAYREDSDVALRIGAEGGRVTQGTRLTLHPARHGDFWFSVRQQRGNADDRLMRRLHGRRWRRRARAPLGRLPGHVATTVLATTALGAGLARRPRLAAAAALGWAAATAELAWCRIEPGPRTSEEVARMLATSAVIPPVALGHTVAGVLRHRRTQPWRGLPDVVLLDRDGTLVHDVPYNGDPAQVVPVDGAREALDRLRAEGVRLALVTNQSGVGSGRLSLDQVAAVNDRVTELLGPFDGVHVCPHARDAGCGCRKPAPGLVKEACRELGATPDRCVLIGDIGSDVGAADAAGARALLVPTPQTLADEVDAARRTDRLVPDLTAAVDRVLGGRW